MIKIQIFDFQKKDPCRFTLFASTTDLPVAGKNNGILQINRANKDLKEYTRTDEFSKRYFSIL